MTRTLPPGVYDTGSFAFAYHVHPPDPDSGVFSHGLEVSHWWILIGDEWHVCDGELFDAIGEKAYDALRRRVLERLEPDED